MYGLGIIMFKLYFHIAVAFYKLYSYIVCCDVEYYSHPAYFHTLPAPLPPSQYNKNNQSA